MSRQKSVLRTCFSRGLAFSFSFIISNCASFFESVTPKILIQTKLTNNPKLQLTLNPRPLPSGQKTVNPSQPNQKPIKIQTQISKTPINQKRPGTQLKTRLTSPISTTTLPTVSHNTTYWYRVGECLLAQALGGNLQ